MLVSSGRAIDERRQVTPEVVAAPLLELGEEPGRPVGLSGRIVDLVGVVEEGAKPGECAACERAVERQQVFRDRIGREVIDHVALAAGRGALDELAVPTGEEGVERPAARRCGPVEVPAVLDARGQIGDIACVRVRHQRGQWQRARDLHLLERKRLQVFAGGDGLGEIG